MQLRVYTYVVELGVVSDCVYVLLRHIALFEEERNPQ